MKKNLLLTAILICSAFFTYAQNWEAGKSYYDENKWTEFIPGNMPLVISVPHGGNILLPDVPVRSCKGAVTVTDTRTIELAMEIQKAFQKKYKVFPSIIISHLSRKNVDQNREIEDGSCGNESMKKPWNQFHNYIDTALAMATRTYGSTLYIDLHGHGHTVQRLELGYSLNGTELPDISKKNKQADLAAKSSLNNLFRLNSKADFEELMIGENSFGTMITKAGSAAIPSKQMPVLNEGEKYFNGGYNTRKYTSSAYPQVFGWQIESNYKGVRDPEGRPVFAKNFSDVIMKFIKENTDIKLP